MAKYIVDPKLLSDKRPKKAKKIETPLEKRNKEPKVSEHYEEDLIRQLFDDKKEKIESEIVQTIQPIQKDNIWIHHKRKNSEWDVPIDEEIKYFDVELSYELTGYRPITMEQGLDFKIDPFIERANKYNSTGKYTEYPMGTKPYMEFWKEEYRRCQEGFQVGKYRITGDHYYFLNYYRMSVIREGATSGSGREESFPGFLSKQYEFFHYVEMAEKLHKDVCILKARGIGLSEIVASLSVRPYTTNRGYNVMITCAAEAKLNPLKRKCWMQLDWLNANTQGGMRHVRQVVNNDNAKRASKLTKDGIEFGWLSQITAVVADTSDKVRGDRLDRLIYEEAGSNKNLVESWIKGDALVALGGYHFGTRIALGTGGDNMALQGLADIFLDPEAFNVLPFKNYDTQTGDPELTSFFIPAHKFALTSEYLDSRGVTDHVRFKEFYINQRKKLKGDKFVTECAEHCFIPEEALAKTGGNIFDAELIAARMGQILTKTDYTEPKRYKLNWDKTSEKQYSKVFGIEHQNGEVLVVEPPLTDENGIPFKNLYVAGIDSIDQGKDESATDNDVSDFCIVIKKRIRGLDDPKYVAMYKGRPRRIREAYEIAHKLLVWYNCQAMLERSKISIQMYLQERHADNLLMKTPEYAVSKRPGKQVSKRLIGVYPSDNIINHGLELITNFLEDYWHTIDFKQMLDELLRYTFANKRKFDIIAALEMAEIGDEALFGIKPTKNISTSEVWQDFGYYRDENGHLHHGAIPSQNKYETRWRQ